MSDANANEKSRNIDIVFCIDGTGSMTPCIEMVKEHALRFHKELKDCIEANRGKMSSLRIKVIVFRDYEYDGDNTMQISEFFELSAGDEAEYKSYLDNVVAQGGGDAPENGLEAIYFAMKSSFKAGPNDRQIIVLFSDTDALKLGARKGCPNYPDDMVDEQGFKDMWNCSSQTGTLNKSLRRLVIIAPPGSYYEKIIEPLEDCYYLPTEDLGLKDVNFNDVIKIIEKSTK